MRNNAGEIPRSARDRKVFPGPLPKDFIFWRLTLLRRAPAVATGVPVGRGELENILHKERKEEDGLVGRASPDRCPGQACRSFQLTGARRLPRRLTAGRVVHSRRCYRQPFRSFCGGRRNRFFCKMDYCISSVCGRRMAFRKETARGKTLLQKSFPPGPPFRKLPNGCGVRGRNDWFGRPHTTNRYISSSP